MPVLRATLSPKALKTARTSTAHRSVRFLIALVVGGITMTGSRAQTTAYRCDSGGRTIYQSQPCAMGTTLDVNDHRTEAQSAANKADTLRLSQFADRTAATNLQRTKAQEASALKQMAAARAAMSKPAPPKVPKTPKPKRIKVSAAKRTTGK